MISKQSFGFLQNIYFFWALLALPSLGMMINGFADPGEVLHGSGELSARLMLVCLFVSPLRMLFPGNRFLGFLLKRRRYLGVAAFGYAAIHTLFYLLDLAEFDKIIADAVRLGIWSGWLAVLLFVPLVLTSNEASVRGLGKRWKSVQRLVYPAAVFTALHWFVIHESWGPIIVFFGPLCVLEAWRYRRYLLRRKQ